MISKETATEIAYAYREVDTAEKLLQEITKALADHNVPDIRDAFGRRPDGLQLGVPSGENSQRLFNMPWSLAKPIIEVHIAQQRAKIVALTEKAKE
jgi:hypothetical protein